MLALILAMLNKPAAKLFSIATMPNLFAEIILSKSAMLNGIAELSLGYAAMQKGIEELSIVKVAKLFIFAEHMNRNAASWFNNSAC